MTNNLLFVYNIDDKQMNFVIKHMSEITCSDTLKFKVFKESVVINFQTTAEFKVLKKFVDVLLTKVSESYFLFKYDENLSISLPDNQMEQFLNVNGINEDETIEQKDEDRIMNTFFEILINTDIPDMEFIGEDLEEEEDVYLKKPRTPKFSLDSILDKINQNGITSLTLQEKEYLKSFK